MLYFYFRCTDFMNLNICVICCAPLWDNFRQVWTRSSYPFLTYNEISADTLRHAVTLTFHLLTLNVSTSCVMCDQTLYQIRAKSNHPPLSYWWFAKFFRPFLRCGLRISTPQRGWTKLHQLWGGQNSVTGAPNLILLYRCCVVSVRTAEQSRRVISKIKATFRTCWPLVIVKGVMGEKSKYDVRVHPNAEPLVYIYWAAAVRSIIRFGLR